MDPSSECQVAPSKMLISPKWGFLLTVLLLVNISLVAWAAAFVPDELPAERLPRVANTSGTESAPPLSTHQPPPVVAEAARDNSASPEEAIAPTPEATHSPTPDVAIHAEWTPETSPPAPRESASPAATTQLPDVPAGLVVINPPSTGGPVHFLLAEEVITLQPGEFHTAAEIDERVVKFDRGEEFGLVEQKVSGEVWMFAVGPRGWHLQLVDRERAARHLEGCRPRSVPAEPSTEAATSAP